MAQIDRTDGLVGNAAVKYPCRMASTANLVLSGLQTIDGVVGAQDDRVLVKNQTTGAENGIYVMDSGSWERAQDADNDLAFTEGSLVKVNQGTVGAGFWYVTNTGTITIDSTALAFSRASTVLANIGAFWQSILVLATELLSRQALILDKHGADIPAAATLNLDNATGDLVDVTGNTGITAITLAEGVEKVLRFTGTPTITNGASLVLPGGESIVAAAGDFARVRGYAAGIVRFVGYQRASGSALENLPPNHLSGLTLTNNATAYKLDVAAGQCRDSTNATDIVLSAAVTGGLLQAAGAWAAGSTQNKLDTGARANSTWYHVWAIKKDADASGDWLFSLSATAPTMPAGYTYKRRVGAVLTDSGGTDIIDFVQDGDYFRWLATVADISVANPGTAAVTRTLTVPTGVNVHAFGFLNAFDTGVAAIAAYLSDLGANDEAATGTRAQGQSQAANVNMPTSFQVRTNTSAQIRSRLSTSNAATTLNITTAGWFDYRGRNA